MAETLKRLNAHAPADYPVGVPRKWIRHWIGKVTDSKFAEVAVVAKTSVAVAIVVFDHLIESAGYMNDGEGTFNVSPRHIAVSMRETEETIEAVLAVMREIGLVTPENRITAWTRRQFPVDDRDKSGSGGKTEQGASRPAASQPADGLEQDHRVIDLANWRPGAQLGAGSGKSGALRVRSQNQIQNPPPPSSARARAPR